MLVWNAIQCLKCGDKIDSLHRHDFKMCSCGSCGCDGGLEYVRRVGEPEDYINLTVYSSEPYERVRRYAYRLSRGPQGKDLLTKITLENMSDKYLEASVKYCEEREQTGEHYKLLLEEVIYRIQHDLTINEENR